MIRTQNKNCLLAGVLWARTAISVAGLIFLGIAARAELAAARTQMILAEQNADLAKVRLAELLGLAGTSVEIEPTLFVPSSSVVRSMEDTFVIRVRNGQTEWVRVKPGVATGEEVEVFDKLAAGEQVVLRGTEELRPDMRVTAKLVPNPHAVQTRPE